MSSCLENPPGGQRPGALLCHSECAPRPSLTVLSQTGESAVDPGTLTGRAMDPDLRIRTPWTRRTLSARLRIKDLRGVAGERSARRTSARFRCLGPTEAAGQRPVLCTDLCTRRGGTGGDGQARRGPAHPVRRGQCRRRRPGETTETLVVLLITQRSQVQILPPLPRPEAGSENGSGLSVVVVYDSAPSDI